MNYEEFMQRYSSTPTGAQAKQNTPAPGSYEAFMQRYGVSVEDNANSQAPGGPLQVAKGGGGLSAAPAAQSAPAPQPKKETNMLYALLGGPVQLDEQAQQRMRQAIESTKPAAVPAAPENGMSEDELQPFREIGQRGAAARVAQLTKAPQAVKKEQAANAYQAALEAKAKQNAGGLLFDQDAQWEFLRQQTPIQQGLNYTADQLLNTFKNVGSVLFGQGKDYVNAYEEEWKRQMGKQDTPLEEAGKAGEALARNLNAGVGQGFQGVAMSADLLLPDNWTPNGVQKGLDWVKNTGERATEYANEFNREQGYGEMGPQLLQAIGGMAPDLALAFFTAGGSAAAKIPQMATAGTGVKETAKQIVQQAVENPQFWLSFARTWGMDYQEALDRGATESQALAAASLGSAVNAAIEVGGGVQTQFQEGAESGLRGVVKSALEEGGEEVGQNIVSNAVNGLIFDPSAPLVSLSDERAVLNPLREANSFAVGAMAGGLMSAPGNLMRTGNRPGAANAQQAVLQPDAKTAEAQAPAVNSEAPAVEMPAGAETYRRLAGLDDSPASRAQGAVTALDVELLQNLARQEQIKMRVQLLVRDPAKTDVVLQSWGELSKLMDRESEIRVQKEVFQRQAEIGAEAVAAVRGSGKDVQKAAEQNPLLELLPEAHYSSGVTIAPNVKADKAAFSQVDQIAKVLGRPVVVENLPQGHNGYYKNGTIHISANSQSPTMNVFTHELTHHLESSGDYAALANYIKNGEAMKTFLASTDMTMEEYRSFLRDSYARMGIRMDERAVDAEIVANFCEKFLFKDENSVRRLCGEKPGLGRRILDFIRRILERLRGGEAAELRQAERLFMNALNGTQTENADMGRRLSLQENAYPQANSGGAGAVSYDALTALPDMELTRISTAIPEGVSISDVARLGVENSRQPGMKNGRVTNRYTGQEIQITAKGLRHGLTSKASMLRNGPYALQAGNILENAVKVNELAPRGKEVRSDIYLGGAVDEAGMVHAVRFVVNLYADGQRTTDLGDMEVYSGDLYAHTGKKTGTVAPKVPEVSGKAATPTVPTITIADLLNVVKGKMDDFLSADAQVKIGMPPRKSPDFGDSQMYSVTPSITPQEWKQGRQAANEGSALQKRTGAYQVPDAQSANGGTSMTRPELTPAASIVSTPGQEVNDGSARNEDTIDLGGARRWLDQKNEARAHADENFMAMGDMEASRLQVNSPENRPRPMRQAERANVEGEDTGRMPELPREVVRDLRPGKKLTGKDIDRVMDSVAPKGGAGRAFLNEHLIKPFFAAKKAYALDSVSNGRKFARQMKALGLVPGSKAAWYLQWYREGLRPVVGADGVLMEEAAPYTLENLKADRPQDWQNIVKAEELYGQWADDYFEIENRSLERVYPNAEQEIRERLDKLDAQAKGFGIKLNEAQAALRKIDPADELESAAAWDNYERIRKQKAANEAEVERLQEQLTSGEALRGKRLQYRKNYVPHRYETQRGFRGLKNILFNADQNIDPHLVGVSDYTKPKSRWAGWMQHRSNDVFQGMDPVSAFLEYMKEVEYKAHLDPVIAQARTLTEELRTKTEATRTENNLVEWLEKWTNDLAGKTGYWDRPVQVDHSRKSMAVLQWLNSRAKANAVMGNLSSALSQVYNLPNAVGMLKNPADMAKGAARYGKLLAGDAETRALVGQSGFLTERYALQNLDSELRRLGADDVDSPAALWRWLGQKPERMAAFMLEVGDKTVAQYTWLSAYEQAVRKGEADPLAYADELTRKSVGGRGVGEMPLVLRNKVVNLIAPFQVETMNAWNMMKDKVREKDLVGLFLTFLATYVLNSIRKEYLDGREVGFDPISAVLDSWEQSGQDEDATMGSRLTATGFRMGGEVLSNMPFGDMVASVALGADSQTAKNLFGEGDPTRFGTGNIGLSALADPVIQLGSAVVNHKPISNVDLKNPLFQLLPSYGGKQLQRSVQAAQDMGLLSNGPFGLPFSGERNEAPGSYNNQGNLRFPIDTGNGLNVAKGLSWGSYATNEGREYLQSGAKPKSVGYTEAYKAGYSTSILDALYPSSSQSAGKATYQQMTGGAPGAAKVDSWMEALMEYNGSKSMMPSNTTTSVTVDGETVKLTGPQALDFAQTKVQTSYSILDALRPQAGNYDRQVQARYAARAQDYAQAVAKEQVLGVEPNAGSWVEELQNYSGVKGKAVNDKLLNALLASSIVEETKPDYYPNGSPVSGSRKRKALASLRAAGFDTRTAMQMWEVFN